MYSIKDMVKDGQKAHFLYFNALTKAFWYKTESGFSFPVPLSDLGDSAILNTEEKAILLMRYIRKHIALLDQARSEADQAAANTQECDQTACACGGVACAN